MAAGLDIVPWGTIITKVIFYGLYAIISILMLVGIGFFYWYMTFNYKLTTWPMFGSTKDGMFSVGKPLKNRIKIIKEGHAWKKLYPLFNKKELEPFDPEYMYPGKQLYAFEFGESMIPARINIEKYEENELRGFLTPVPHHVRNWQSLKHKENAREFAEHNWWEDNKHYFITVITVLACVILAGITIWFVLKYATGGTDAIKGLTKEIGNLKFIAGKPPG